jgi:hypothetical protein
MTYQSVQQHFYVFDTPLLNFLDFNENVTDCGLLGCETIWSYRTIYYEGFPEINDAS